MRPRVRLVALAAAAAATAGATVAVLPACDIAGSPDKVCEDFCHHRCGFYNTSAGERGQPGTLTIYRLTPNNVTGIRNKDTGDPPGDIGYWLTKKNITRECTLNPQGQGCIDNGANVYGVFTLEVDGQFGPYLQCNPLHVGGADPVKKPLWKDTRLFVCGMACLYPTATGCHSDDGKPDPNGTSWDGSYHCHCDGTRRHTRTVGRATPPFLAGQSFAPKSWVPQCKSGYTPPPPGTCMEGQTVSKTLHAWSFESLLAMACKECSKDPNCTAWATTDNRTARLYRGFAEPKPSRVPCTSAQAGPWSKGSNWFGVGDLGGYWYSTTPEGECSPGAPIGTGGCTWREVGSTYKNASCVDSWVDAAVEDFGKDCLRHCGPTINRTSDCYLDCYRSVLQGDAALNMTKIPNHKVIEPWVRAFQETDPRRGGCPIVSPAHCEGLQCDPLAAASSQDVLSIVV